jgi:hypothetical protein
VKALALHNNQVNNSFVNMKVNYLLMNWNNKEIVDEKVHSETWQKKTHEILVTYTHTPRGINITRVLSSLKSPSPAVLVQEKRNHNFVSLSRFFPTQSFWQSSVLSLCNRRLCVRIIIARLCCAIREGRRNWRNTPVHGHKILSHRFQWKFNVLKVVPLEICCVLGRSERRIYI